MNIPKTSVTLLQAISDSSDSVRWTEFYNRYLSVMTGFLSAHFNYVEFDEVIQRTMIALMKALPNYKYVPDSGMHFHNYLTGILKHKALDYIAERKSQSDTLKKLKSEPRINDYSEQCDRSWKETVMYVALDQLLADETIQPRNREIFKHLVKDKEKPEQVADQFGISRGNVDVIKLRMMTALKEKVNALIKL